MLLEEFPMRTKSHYTVHLNASVEWLVVWMFWGWVVNRRFKVGKDESSNVEFCLCKVHNKELTGMWRSSISDQRAAGGSIHSESLSTKTVCRRKTGMSPVETKWWNQESLLLLYHQLPYRALVAASLKHFYYNHLTFFTHVQGNTFCFKSFSWQAGGLLLITLMYLKKVNR